MTRDFHETAFHFIYLFCFSTQLNAQGLKYADGNEGWNADSFGTHRVLVQFNKTGNTRVINPWRHRECNQQGKRIIIQDRRWFQ